MRWLLVGLVALVLLVCAWQPAALRQVFAGVAPDGAYTGLLGLLVLLALLVVPGAVAGLVRRGVSLRAAAAEAFVWGALAVPAVLVAWKAAPHPSEALAPTLLLVALIWAAGVAWGLAQARSPGVARYWVLVVCVMLALPALAFVLSVFGERSPWWLLPASPLWLLADTTPPSPSLARSLALDAALVLWASLFVLGIAWSVVAAPTDAATTLRIRRRRIMTASGLSVLGLGGLVLAAACALGATSLGSRALFAHEASDGVSTSLLRVAQQHTADVPGELEDAAVEFGVEISARFNFGEFGGDGFALPLTVALTTPPGRSVEGGVLHIAASNFATQTPLPALSADARTVLEVGAVLPPGIRTVRLAVQRSADGAWLGATQLPVPAYPVAEGALRGDFDRRAPQYLAGLLVAERAQQRDAYTGYRDSRRAAVPLAGSDLPHGWGAYQALSAVVLTTAARDELTPATRRALARWVRMGGILVYLGHERSESLWHDQLTRLDLAPPPPLTTSPPRAAGEWRYEARHVLPAHYLGESEVVDADHAEKLDATLKGRAWRAVRGAGQIVRLTLPEPECIAAALDATVRPAELLKAWLDAELTGPRDPLRCYEAEQGGRLLASDLPQSAFREDALRDVPVGAFGHGSFAWLLVTALALVGVWLYRVRPLWQRTALLLVATALTAVLAATVPTRHVEVLELPVWVTRAAAADTGAAYEVRYVQVTRRKHGAAPVLLTATHELAEFVPASSADEALGRLPATLHAPLLTRTSGDDAAPGVATAQAPGSRLELGTLRSGEFRLARLGGLTPGTVDVTLEPHGEGQTRLRLGDGLTLRGLMLVDSFRVAPLAARLEGGAVVELPSNVAEQGVRYREVLTALVYDEAFADDATRLPRNERLALRSMVANAIGRDRRFLAAVVDKPPAPRIQADGPTTTRRAILFIPLAQ